MQMYDLAPRGVNPLDRRCFLHLIRERQTRAQCRIPPGSTTSGPTRCSSPRFVPGREPASK
jgi:hypothetical protein